MTETEITRDLIGYGPNPPNPQWPNNARIAVNFVVNYEEGSENTIPTATVGLRLGWRKLLVVGWLRACAISAWKAYTNMVAGPASGVCSDLWGATFAAHGLWLRPRYGTQSEGRGGDCGGRLRYLWAWLAMDRALSPGGGRRARTHRSRRRDHRASDGTQPRGWYCRYAPSANTRRLLVEHGGFLYDSDSYADDLPYWTSVTGKSHLIVPYSLDANDLKFQPGGNFSSADGFYAYLKDLFDLLYTEGETAPKMMNVGLHARMMGRFGSRRWTGPLSGLRARLQ